MLAIAAPWHVLATLRNPPYFDLLDAQRSRPISRFFVVLFHQRAGAAVSEPALSARLQHRPARLVLAASSGMAVSLERLFSGRSRSFPFARWTAPAARACWLLLDRFHLVFFTFSTTQEYYSMPCYPALALLIGSAMAAGGRLGAARYPCPLRLSCVLRIAARCGSWCATFPRPAIFLPRSAPIPARTRFRSATWRT